MQFIDINAVIQKVFQGELLERGERLALAGHIRSLARQEPRDEQLHSSSALRNEFENHQSYRRGLISRHHTHRFIGNAAILAS